MHEIGESKCDIESLKDFLDKDNDGRVKKQDLMAAMSEMGEDIEASEVDMIVDQFDSNGDDEIDFDIIKTVFYS